MTQRTSRMMRIPGALVPAVRELTLAWHLRERDVGRGRGPMVAGAPAQDDVAPDVLLERQRAAVERLREELDAAERELVETERKQAGL